MYYLIFLKTIVPLEKNRNLTLNHMTSDCRKYTYGRQADFYRFLQGIKGE